MITPRRVVLWLGQALLALTLFAAPASAEQPTLAPIQAHPVLWTVHGPKGTAYLFGSLHLMPTNVLWHRPEIDEAIAKSDVFVFEIATGDQTNARMQAFIAQNGTLPPDQSLPSMLTEKMRSDYRRVLDLTHVRPEVLLNKRPWLAGLVLSVASMTSQNFAPDSGVDQKILGIAKAKRKELEYFETIDEQLNLLMPTDPKLELAEFASTLKEILDAKQAAENFLDAWSRGDAEALDRLMKAGATKADEKMMFTDRNAKWVTQLESMLGQRRTYFVTVGAGHLVGPHSVPAMLRAKGYQVDGP